MLTVSQLNAKVSALKIPPEAYDAIFPHFHLSQSLIEYMASSVVRDIGLKVQDKAVQTRLHGIGKQMMLNAVKGMTQGWEDGDDICPPWPPFPRGPWWDLVSAADPEPVPWKVGAVEQVVLAELLIDVAGITTNIEFTTELKSAASALAKGVAQHLAADFENSQVKPRALQTRPTTHTTSM